MIAALLCGCAAVVLWPSRQGSGRLRRPGRPWPAIPLSPALTGLAATAVGAVLSTPLVAVLSGGCAWLAVRSWGARRRAAAAEGELLALAEGLGVLAAELAAGRDVAAAAEAVADACADPRSARALVAALRDEPLAEGMPSWGSAAGALARIRGAARLSERTGCSLAEVATVLADDLRARHRAGLELRAASAGPRASAAVLAGLPVLGLAMGSGIGADPWRVLTTTGPGQLLLVGGVGLEALGLAWSARLQRRALGEAGRRAGGRAP